MHNFSSCLVASNTQKILFIISNHNVNVLIPPQNPQIVPRRLPLCCYHYVAAHWHQNEASVAGFEFRRLSPASVVVLIPHVSSALVVIVTPGFSSGQFPHLHPEVRMPMIQSFSYHPNTIKNTHYCARRLNLIDWRRKRGWRLGSFVQGFGKVSLALSQLFP